MKKFRVGFTLVEIFIVLTIMGVLTGLGGVRYAKEVESARQQDIQVNCKRLEETELELRIRGSSLMGEEVKKEQQEYIDKQGVSSKKVEEKLYKIDENKLVGRLSSIPYIVDYTLGDSGKVRYYGKIHGGVKTPTDPTDPKNPTDPTNPTGPLIPTGPKVGDKEEVGDYTYTYMGESWNVQATKKDKTTYGEIETEVKGYPVVSMDNVYEGCTRITSVPAIPLQIKSIRFAYSGCSNLKTAPLIHKEILDMTGAFKDCTRLGGDMTINTQAPKYAGVFENAVVVGPLYLKGEMPIEVKTELCKTAKSTFVRLPLGEEIKQGDYKYVLEANGWRVEVQDKMKGAYGVIPDILHNVKVISLNSTFMNCKNLKEAPAIPTHIKSMVNTYSGCTALVTAAPLHTELLEVDMTGTYSGCTNLTGTLRVGTIPSKIDNCFKDAVVTPNKLILEPVSLPYTALEPMATTSNTKNVSVKYPAVFDGAEVTQGDYKYIYYNYLKGWHVRVLDKTKSTYEPVLSEVWGVPVCNLTETYRDCKNLIAAPEIPITITKMDATYQGCVKMKSATAVPEGVRGLENTYEGCTSLVTTPELPKDISDLKSTFKGCTSLTRVQNFPSNLTTLSTSFDGCSKLVTLPAFPPSLKNISFAFRGCSSLKTIPTFPTNLEYMVGAFQECKALTTVPAIPTSVKSLMGTFYSTGLTTAPVIPATVTDISNCFQECGNLKGDLVVNGNPKILYCLTGASKGTNKLVIKGAASADTKRQLKETALYGDTYENISIA